MERISRDNAALCLIDHQIGLVTGGRDLTVNAWDEPAFVKAVKKTGRTHLIFAGVSLQVCAAYPAYSAIEEGYASYVVLDASGVLSPAEREAEVARLTQKGVILTDYLSIITEIMHTNVDPEPPQADLHGNQLADGAVAVARE